jgi:hypothetical protein
MVLSTPSTRHQSNNKNVDASILAPQACLGFVPETM